MSRSPNDPIALLAGKPASERPAVAQKWIRAATSDQLKALGDADRLNLLQTALADRPDDVHDIAGRVFESAPLSPALQDKSLFAAAALTEWLETHHGLLRMRRNWPLLSRTEQREWLQGAVDQHCRFLGIESARVTLYEQAPDNGFIRNAYYDSTSREIAFNTHPQAAFSRFIDVIAIAAHETSHHQQWQLISEVTGARITPSHPFYQAAAWFYLNNLPGLYQRPADGMAAYLNQPAERHAFAVEAAVLAHLRRRVPDMTMFSRFHLRQALTPKGIGP